MNLSSEYMLSASLQNLISVIIEGFKPVLISQEPEDQGEFSCGFTSIFILD